jgi:DNA-binding response OmpR family regulator
VDSPFSPPAPPRNPRVLIAEDEPAILELVNYALARAGRYEVYNARDGQTALDYARSLLPDVVVLDVIMPRMHGLAVCKDIKGSAATQRIGVIMLTALGTAYTKREAAKFGADAFLTKPFAPRELVNTVDIVLRRERRANTPADAGGAVWTFSLGDRVLVLAGPGEPESAGAVLGTTFNPRAPQDWGYVVALASGEERFVRWDCLRPASRVLDRAV